MDVTLQYFEDCPHWITTAHHLEALARENADLVVTRQVVTSQEEAERIGFHGSPSILVDGVDAFTGPDGPVGLTCRLYQTPDGPAGSPTLEQIREVLTAG